MTRKEHLQRLADRAAWLRKEAPEVREQVLVDRAYADWYWPEVEATVGWAAFVASRRARELTRAMLGKRRKR